MLNLSVILVKQAILATTILALKFIICLFIQGGKRVLNGTRPPEDVKIFPKAGLQSFDGSKKIYKTDDSKKIEKYQEEDKRWIRLVQNDIESIPIGIMIIWCSILCGCNVLIHSLSMWIYVLCRIVHTISYAYAIQPYRAISWLIGITMMISMLINSCLSAYYL